MADFVYDNVALPALKVPDIRPVPVGQESSYWGMTDANAVLNALTSLRSTVPVINVKNAKFGAVGNGIADDTAALQAAINAGYGKIVHIPRGIYKITAPLVITPLQGAGNSQLPIIIRGEGFDANGGGAGDPTVAGTAISVSGAGDGFQIINASATINSNNLILLENFGIFGDASNTAGGNGITAQKVSGMVLQRLWIQDMRGHGLSLTQCFGSIVDTVLILRSRLNGIYINKEFNNGIIRACRVFGSGRIYSQAFANVWFDGAVGHESLGARLEANDFSYSGINAFQKFKTSDGTIVSIVVAANVATVTTSTPHNLLAGNPFSIVSAATAGLNPHPYSYSVASVPTSTTFTFATTGVANGTYNNASDPNLLLQPSSFGMFLSYVRGLHIGTAYAEDTSDALIYMSGTGINGVEIHGGYFQGQWVSVDGGAGIDVRGVYFAAGQQGVAGAAGVAVNGNYDADIATSNVFGTNTAFTKPSIFKRDGKWFSSAAPTTGTWAQGDLVWSTAPVAGGTPGWVCVVAGTPGTWSAMQSVGALVLSRVLPTWGANIAVDASTGNYFEVVASTNVAHNFNAPTNPTTGQRITYKVKNTSGGVLGAATWNAIFKMLAWTPPTSPNNATISFVYDGTNWVQDSPQSVNVPN